MEVLQTKGGELVAVVKTGDGAIWLTSDLVAYTVDAIPKWNPTNICSYHLQEAGATPVQEIAYAMANALAC